MEYVNLPCCRVQDEIGTLPWWSILSICERNLVFLEMRRKSRVQLEFAQSSFSFDISCYPDKMDSIDKAKPPVRVGRKAKARSAPVMTEKLATSGSG
jgi:hypothetical protein